MTLKCYVFLLMILLCCSVVFVSADQYSDEEAVYRFLEEIVSSVSKYDQQASEAPAIVSVISRTQIENSGARNLIDIIKTLPGIEIFLTHDGYYEVAFRGIRGMANVLFMLDGHRLNSFYDGQSLYNFSADNIERVELIRGPGSSIHGTNAFVGVINIISRFQEDGYKVKTTIGDWNTRKVSVYSGHSIDADKKLSVWAHYLKTDGQDDISIDNNRNDGYADDEIEQNYLNIIYKSNDRNYSLNYIKENRGAYIGSDYRLDDNQKFEQQQIIFNYYTNPLCLTDNLSYSLKSYVDFGDYNKLIYQGDIGEEKAYSKIDYKTQTVGSELLFNYEPVDNHKIISGIQLEYLSLSGYKFLTNYEKLKDLIYLPEITSPMEFFLFGTDISQATYKGLFDNYHLLEFPQNNNRYIMGIFVQDEWRVHQNFITTLGLRFDNYSDFGSTLNPKIAFVSPLNMTNDISLSVKGAYATAFRAPTFQELYDRSQIATKNGSNGNPDLKPEKITTYELGVELRVLDSIRGSINYFNNRIKDNIFAQNVNKLYGAQGEYDRYENINGIDIDGFEFEVRYDYDRNNYLFFNYSYFEAENRGGYIVSQDADGVHRSDYKSYMTEVPQKRYNACLNIDGTIFGLFENENLKKFKLNTAYHYGAERYVNLLDINSISGFSYSNSSGRRWKIDKYNIINMSLSTSPYFSSKYSFQFSVFNLTDEKLYDNYPDVVPITTAGDWSTEKLIPKPERYYEFCLSINF